MQTVTLTVPNISCGHCTHTIEMELSDIAGVQSVQASQESKEVVVKWDAPATLDEIKATLVEINYAPAE